ncbi:MAG: DUF5677 domain-containing protein [Flavobacterium sp.]|uniref:DUF5677 domain-containing protein n=1 Tax=Flavobacterium sp. TaxID=239 RepID=UPI003BDDEB04
MKNFQLRLKTLVVQLHKSADSYNRLETSTKKEFKLIVKSSFIKQLETLNALVTESTEKSKFLFIPLLRGSCEDLIALNYIKQIFGRKSNRLVKLQITLGVNKSLTNQKVFFAKYRQNQRVLTEDDILEIDRVKNEFKLLLQSKGINGNKLPSTEVMSKQIGMDDYYEFVFRGTSDFVHFNNGILARMAWSYKSGGMHLSTNNFNDYYSQFSYFYSAFVFVKFCELFKKEIELTKSDLVIISKMNNLILTEHFWPELVTFEEMNIRRPQQITRILSESFSRLSRVE